MNLISMNAATAESSPATPPLAPATPRPSGYIPTLDGWRAIAILAVIVAHGFPPPTSNGALAQSFYRYTRLGALGVDIFFGISGYLICSRLLDEIDKRGQINLIGFYTRRFCRILPPYLAYLFVLGAIGLVGSGIEWISCLSFVRNYVPLESAAWGWYTGHFWSLAVEEHFYLLLPGLLFLLGARRGFWACAALAIAIAAWRSIEFRHGILTRHLPDDVSFFVRTDVRLDALLWGAACAIIATRRRLQPLLKRLLGWPSLLMLAVAFCVLAAREIPQKMLLMAMIVPLVLVSTSFNPDMAFSRFLEAAPLRWIGRLSYSLYIWQSLFLVANKVAPPLSVPQLQTFPVNILAILACSAASYYAIERPFTRLGHRLATPVTPGRNN